MNNRRKNFDWGDVVVWGFILAVPCGLLGGIFGIQPIMQFAAVLLIPFAAVAAMAFLGQVLFAGKDIAKDARNTFGNGRTFGKRKTTRR